MQETGDVAARVAVRFDELFESTRLLRMLLGRLPDGPVRTDVAPPPAGSLGVGWVEGWFFYDKMLHNYRSANTIYDNNTFMKVWLEK